MRRIGGTAPGFSIAGLLSLNAAVDSGLYQQALLAALFSNRAEAEEKTFELSVEMALASGSMIPFYSLNAVMSCLGEGE